MTIINTNSISGINSITAQGASGIEFYESSGVNQRFNITSGGLVDISGGVQVSENITPTSGAGLELFREGGGGGQIQAFDRSGSAWLPLILKGSTQTFHTNGSERLSITSGGNVSITDGNLVVASGHGIDFSATSHAPGMTSELLNDYEEGTWTPTLNNFTLGNGILTGQYTKIGNIVHVTFRLDAGSTTTFTGNADGISGLPFTNAVGSNTGYLTGSNPSNNWFGFTQQYSTGTGTNFIQWITSSNNHQVGGATVPFTWGSSTIMRFNMTYRAA